jgi:hypothetical protein
VDELILHLRVAIAAHVLRNDQLFDLLEVGLEVLYTDLCELLKDLEILLGVLHHSAEGLLATLAEDPAFAVPCEGAGDGEVGLLAVANGVADGFFDLESLLLGLFESGVALLDVIVHDLSVSDEDDVGVVLADHLLRHLPGLVATSTPHLGNRNLEIVEVGDAGVVVPEVVVTDLATVFGEDIVNHRPVISEAAYGARVVQKDCVLLLLHLYNYKFFSFTWALKEFFYNYRIKTDIYKR